MSIFSRVAFAALWLFVLTLAGEKALMLGAFGSIAKLTGFVAIGLGALAILIEQRIRIPSPFHCAFAVFILWGGFTIYWTVARDTPSPIEWTYLRLTTYFQLFAMTLLVWQLATTEKRVHALLNAYVLGTLAPFVATVRNYVGKEKTLYYQRYSLDNTEPNDLALILAISLPISYYLFLRAKGPLRILYLALILCALGTVLLTASRSGSIATVLALSIIFWTRKELAPRWRVGLIVAFSILAAGAVTMVPVTTWTRLATIGSEVSSGTLNSRTVIWEEGWKALSKSPFLGVGIGAYPDAMVPFFGRPRTGIFTPVAHNTFYSVLVETGLIGFIVFAIMFGIILYYAFTVPGLMKPFWLTTIAVWSLGVMSLSWDDRKPTWLMFSLLAAHSAALRGRSRTAADDVPTWTGSTSIQWEEVTS